MRAKTASSALVAAVTGIVLASPAPAQSAREVLETAVERQQKRLAGIETVTIVQEVMGYEVTNELEKRMVDGRPILVLKGTGEESDDFGIDYSEFMEAADYAKLAGTETIDGVSCHVVRVDDMSQLAWDPEMGEGDADFTPKTATLYMDRDDYLVRKMVVEGEGHRDGRTIPVTMTMMLSDYREVDGWIHPFLTEMTITGMAGGMSEEDMAKARESLEEMKKQMEEMSPEQREMMEKMMKGQMERLEEMVNSGEMNMTVKVKELRVNS